MVSRRGTVTGIDGVVLRSVDPARLGRWYAERLKVDMQARPSERPAGGG
jgi:hypothetical protein